MTLFIIVYMTWGFGAPLSSYHGRDDHNYLYGVLLYILLVSIANAKAVLETSSITIISVMSAASSVILLFLALIFDACLYELPGQDLQLGDMLWHTPWPMTLFVIMLAFAITFLPDITFKVLASCFDSIYFV